MKTTTATPNTKAPRDLVKGDVVLGGYWNRDGQFVTDDPRYQDQTVQSARTYKDTVVVRWTDTKRPTTFGNFDTKVAVR